ncbi:MAG: thiamine phosphate synthase [Sphingobium sp.]|nr:thiamine phosphate synthase [Sphingobium sp.]
MRQGQGKSWKKVPGLWLMTDERVGDVDLLRTIARLPRGSAVVFRHYSLPESERRALFDQVARAAHRRHVLVLLAGDPVMARDWGADGHHGRTGRPFRTRRDWLHSAPVHDHRELVAARRVGADVLLVSPLFATRSHPGARLLGPARFAALAREASVPVIALGGVKKRHASCARALGASGYAAIDGLTVRPTRTSC